MRPAFSWLPARDGPSSETPLTPNVRGSAPYLSWLARSLADAGREVAGDLRRAVGAVEPLVVGALIVSPSSTIAKRLRLVVAGLRLLRTAAR